MSCPRRPLIAALTLAIGLLVSAHAQAAITVANQNDGGPGSLRQAIAEAPAGETIILPAGTYTLTSEALLITRALTIEGHGATDTTVRAGGSFGLFAFIGSFDATLSGLTLRDSIVTTPGGGAVVALDANLTLRNDIVTHNSIIHNGASGKEGGTSTGAGVTEVGGRLTLIGASITNNTTQANGGSGGAGGTAESAGVAVVGSFQVENSTIADNLAEAIGGQGPSSAEQKGGQALGAGFTAVQSGTVPSSITHTTISSNRADASGGPGGANGEAVGSGVEVVSEAPTTVADTTIADNVARALGSGVGKSVDGAGLFAVKSPSAAPLKLYGLTIAANRIEAPPASKSEGGNLYMIGKSEVGDTIIAAGSGPVGSENCAGNPLTSVGFNIDSLDQCGFHGTADKVNTNPLLGPLQDNGGPTQTMAPALSSPAIDQGAALGLASDQRGVPRPIDLPSVPNSSAAGADGADIGAYELQPSNAFTIGKLKKNKKKGTATLSVNLPQPSAGVLGLTGKGLRSQSRAVAGQAVIELKLATQGGAAKSLRKKGKRKVKFQVSYTPTDNQALAQVRTTKLIRQHKKKKKT